MPAAPSPLSRVWSDAGRRFYAVVPAGLWWRIVSIEGEVARYRTQVAAMAGAAGLVDAMRRLGVESEVLLEDPLQPTGPAV